MKYCSLIGRICQRLGQVAEDIGTATYAWALLDNHAHILMRSGPAGISILTGYAISYKGIDLNWWVGT